MIMNIGKNSFRQFLVLVLVICTVALITGCSGTSSEKLAKIPPAQRISALAKPGVVLIYTQISGTVAIPEVAVDPYTGEAYLTGRVQELDVASGVTGSGFIVSSDGYIITNAHVVSFDEKAIKRMLLSAAVEKLAREAGSQLTQQDLQILQNYVFNYGRVVDHKVTITCILGVPVKGVGKIIKGYTADVRKVGKPAPGKDIAIIKIEGKNFPTVKLGDSDKVQVGDKIYVIGYPGAATFHPYLSSVSITEPSVTAGIVSARKMMKEGFEVLQIDAAITHGNSGGPVFNEKGEVVGIATFGSIDYSTWREVQGFNFMIPINLAKEFMKEINIKNKRGPVDEHYEKGLIYYWNGEYRKAIEEFNIVKNLFPAHPYVDEYISKCQEKILEKK